MNKYLIELIKLQTSVILPGFGSLMIGNSKTGKIVFNPLLKFNDGALAKYIAQKEGIDQQNAQNQIAKFVREIEAELGKGNSFGIFQLGKFVKNEKGEVEFIHEGDAIIPPAQSTKPAVAKEVKEPVVEKKEEPKPEIKAEVVKEVKPIVEQKTEPILPKTPEVKSESLLDKLKSSESKAETKITDTAKQAEAKATEEASKQIKNSFTPDDKKSAPISENPKADEKPIEITKNIPLAEASKKDPAAQEKNVFKPADAAKKEVEKVESKVEEKLVAAADSIKSDNKSNEAKADDSKTKKPEPPKKESVKEKFKKDKPQKVKHENPENKKPKKKKRWLVWLILLIIIGGGSAAGWMYQDKIKSFLFAGVGDHDKDSTHTTTPDHTHDSTAVSHDTEIIPEDTSMTEEIVDEIVEEPVEEVKENPVVNHSSPGGTYHIIGNAFSSEKNAENYVNKMKEKGYSAQNIGKYNGLYLVSLKSFGSKDEAKNNLSSVKADAEGAYVFTAK
jgi:nucleoid DNA-binding protein